MGKVRVMRGREREEEEHVVVALTLHKMKGNVLVFSCFIITHQDM
jgi:hypothetical protein